VADDASSSLAAIVARARAAWPGVTLGDAAFERYLAERAAGADVASLHAADLYLAAACAEGDPIALSAIDRVFAEVPAMVERTGGSRAVGEDAAQILREKLLLAREGAPPGIVAYTGRGALRGWLRVAAVRIAVSLRRGDRTAARDADEVAAGGIDPELALIQARYGEAFRAAFAAALAALPPSERAVLRLHFADGLNLERLAAVIGVSRATAGRRVVAARKLVLDETLRELGVRLRATPTEIESLLAIVRSKLDVSLGALVAESSRGAP
jgi:RNA polymerase sigma-70 factor (ECF subfamily)